MHHEPEDLPDRNDGPDADLPEQPTPPPVADPLEHPTPPPVASPPAPPARPGTGRYVAIGLVVALAAAGTAWIATRSDTGASATAGDPTAAVEAMIGMVGEGRIVDLVRAEFPWAGELGAVDQTALETAGLPDGRIDGLKLSGVDLTYATQAIGDEIAVVTITGGSFRAGIDTAKLPPALLQSLPFAASGVPQIAFEQTIPVATVAGGLCGGLPSGPSRCNGGLPLVTVDDGDGWRVSWAHTLMYLGTDFTLEARAPGGADTPAGIADALADAIATGDVDAALDLLDPAEFAFLRDFAFETVEPDGGPIEIEVSVIDETSTTARLHIDRLAGTDTEDVFDPATGDFVEREVPFAFDGDCATEGGEQVGCLSDLADMDLGPFSMFEPLVDAIANDGVNIGAVQRNDRWYASATETLRPYAAIFEAIGEQIEALTKTCREAAASGADPSSLPPECSAFLGGLLPGMGGFGAPMLTG